MALSVGDVIKLGRKKRGLTQEELGLLLNVGKSTVQKYENGYVQNLKLKTIQELCFHLKILPWMLIFPNDVKIEAFDLYIKHYIQAYNIYHALNREGQLKVFDYAHDLLLAEKYQDEKVLTAYQNNDIHPNFS